VNNSDNILAELLGVDANELRDGAPSHMLTVGHIAGSCPLPRHRAVVDSRARRVRCKSCGVDLDPIEVITDLARHHEWYARLITDGNRLAKEVAELEQQHAKLKAATRRAREAYREASAKAKGATT
jgi:hypothetical protein